MSKIDWGFEEADDFSDGRDGEDVVDLQGDGTLDAAVATSNLIFDSSTATGGFGLYKVFSIKKELCYDWLLNNKRTKENHSNYILYGY